MFRNVTMLDAVEATGAGSSHPNNEAHFTFTAVQADGTSATVLVQGSNDATNWFTVATHSLSNDADAQTVTSGKWKFLRGNVTALTGGNVTLVKTI